MSFANWKKDQWESNLDTKLTNFYRASKKENLDKMELMKTQRDGKIIINEIRKELKNFNSSNLYSYDKMKELLASIENNNMVKTDYLQLHNYFASTRDYYKGVYNKADISKDSLLRSYIKPSKKLTSKLKDYKKDKTISSREYRSL